jgi:soluble P-type ATPase
MPIPKPNKDESKNDFIKRCMLDHTMVSEYEISQRNAICQDSFDTKLATQKISFDYDGTLSTKQGYEKANQLINEGVEVYIISARENKEGMIARAKKLGIPESKIYATGSNKAKIEKIKELGITKHYDNNKDVIKELGNIGELIN